MSSLEQVFHREKAWIAECDDVDALMDRIRDYRDDVRVAERDGNMLLRMRAGDLVELAQGRAVWLKARALREEQAASAPPRREPATAPARAPSLPRRPVESSRTVAVQPGPESSSAVRGRMESEKAATRLANAQAAQLEAQAALLKAQAEAAMREHAPAKPAPPAPGRQQGGQVRTSAMPAAVRAGDTTSPLAPAHPRTAAPGAATRVDRPALDLRRSRPAAPSRPPAAPASSATRTSAKPAQRSVAPQPRSAVSLDVPSAFERAIRERMSAAPPASTVPSAPPNLAATDRVALESVGKWPPLPPSTSPFATPTDDYPPEWTLTGYDLAMFRGRLGITQKVLAGQLGVEQGTISKAEGAPRTKLGPTLQVALRKAMEDHRDDPNRPRRNIPSE